MLSVAACSFPKTNGKIRVTKCLWQEVMEVNELYDYGAGRAGSGPPWGV